MTTQPMPSPADKIRVIHQSLRCFVFGLLGLIPVLGFPFSVLAIVSRLKARASARAEWNPAEYYLAWGAGLAWFGVLVSLGLLAVLLSKFYEP